jgi:hypothetical protein
MLFKNTLSSLHDKREALEKEFARGILRFIQTNNS